MSEEAANTPTGAGQPTPKDAFFFLMILSNMKNKPEVDWEVVATKAGYNNANTAKVRFAQIKKKLGFNDDGTQPSAPTSEKKAKTPRTPRAKKEKAGGSGTNITPSKVTKKRTPTGSAKKKGVKVEAAEDIKAEDEAEGDGDDEMKNTDDLENGDESFNSKEDIEA